MSALSPTRARASTSWWGHLLWVLAAAILGFVIAAVFAGQLHLVRPLYLVVYVVSVSAFLYGYIRWSGINVGGLFLHHWLWGIITAAVVSPLMVIGVLQQPASPTPQGLALVFDLLWLGIIYGAADALLLNVFPILAADIASESAILTHDNEQHWRVFHQQVQQVLAESPNRAGASEDARQAPES